MPFDSLLNIKGRIFSSKKKTIQYKIVRVLDIDFSVIIFFPSYYLCPIYSKVVISYMEVYSLTNYYIRTRTWQNINNYH